MSDSHDELADLDPPLRLADLTALVLSGALPAQKYLAACMAVKDVSFWRRWAGHALLALAAGHLLAGVIFFFAFNWATLPVWAKFTAVEGALILLAVAWWRAGLDCLAGQALGIAVTVLLGVLMAVFGQIYQTGADAYELFLNWALLSLPIVIAARSWSHWLLWLLIANTAGTTFSIQAPEAPEFTGSSFSCALTGANLAVLIGLEMARSRFTPPPWFRYILICAVLLLAVITAGIGLFDDRQDLLQASWRWLAILLPPVILITAYYRARFLLPDFAVVAVSTFGGLAVIFVLVIKLCLETFRWDDFALYGIVGLTAPCLVGLGALHLRKLWALSGVKN